MFKYLYMVNCANVRPKNAENGSLARQTLGPTELQLCRHDPWVSTKCFHPKKNVQKCYPGLGKKELKFFI